VIHAFREYISPHLGSLGGWSYAILVFFVMIEGPFATILGSAAASAGVLRADLVFFACAAGNLLGDVMWYALGRLVPRAWLVRFGGLFGIRGTVVEDLEERVRDNAARIVLVAKLTWLMAQETFIVLGMARVPLQRWLGLDALAECAWTGALVSSGYWLVRWVETFQQWVQWLSLGVYVVLILGGIRLIRHLAAESRSQEPVAV
jgi:membrane protein DedA with SNARE-associated domain